jgi:hypothetical protein
MTHPLPFKLHVAATCRTDCEVEGDHLLALVDYLVAEGFVLDGPIRFQIPGIWRGHHLHNHDISARAIYHDWTELSKEHPLIRALDMKNTTSVQFRTYPVAKL